MNQNLLKAVQQSEVQLTGLLKSVWPLCCLFHIAVPVQH